MQNTNDIFVLADKLPREVLKKLIQWNSALKFRKTKPEKLRDTISALLSSKFISKTQNENSKNSWTWSKTY